jgi:hypothetical protein
MGVPDQISKTVQYRVSWPDGDVDNPFNVIDYGQAICDVAGGCCSALTPQYCWPGFNTPQVGPGFLFADNVCRCDH